MRGLCLPEVVHRFADPPARVDTARVCGRETSRSQLHTGRAGGEGDIEAVVDEQDGRTDGQANSKLIIDRKSTRLNSSHSQISYAVFCLKKKNKYETNSRCLRE